MRATFSLLLLILSIAGGFSQTSGIVDSLKHKLQTITGNDIAKTKILLNICYLQMNGGNPSDNANYAKQALLLAEKTQNEEHIALAYHYLGESETRMGNYSDAIESFIKSAEIFRKLGNSFREAHALGSIGDAFALTNDLYNAIKYNTLAINLFDQFHDTITVAVKHANIGEAYRGMSMPDSALHCYLKAKKILNTVKDTINNYYFAHAKYNLSGNIGMVYITKNDYDTAKEYLEPAIDYFSKMGDSYRFSVFQNELGKILIQEGRLKEGETKLLESLNVATENKLKEQIRDFSLDLSNYYESHKKPQNALKYYKQYKSYQDSIRNVEQVRNMEQQQSRYELSLKQEEITALHKINNLQKIIAFVLLLSIAAVSTLLYILNRKNKKVKIVNNYLIEQKSLLEKRESEKSLLLKELNHRVKNNLQMVSSLLSLHARQLKDHPAAEALNAGRRRVEALTLIHQKLYRDNIDTKIDIKDYIEELTQSLVFNFGKDFELYLNLQPLVTNIDKAVALGLLLNELITNSLKYGGENNPSPMLNISIVYNNNFVTLTIKDNGKGLPENFDISNTTSFGLKLVHSLAKQLNGEINYSYQKGSCWKLTLVKSNLI